MVPEKQSDNGREVACHLYGNGAGNALQRVFGEAAKH
jgi:hypothetical protein